MPYVCRDCRLVLTPEKPTNKCPQCGSIYLLPRDIKLVRRTKKVSIKLSERFLSLILGTVFGLLTFFVWGVTVLINGGPGAGKAAAGAFYVGLKLSLVLAICVGIAGFILGGEKLARLLGILWGTDKEFNERLDTLVCSIPVWVIYLVLALVIIGTYGYLAAEL